MKLSVSLLAALVASATFLFCVEVSIAEQTQASPLRVGIITPLTGGVATWGMSVRSAIELANKRSEAPAELFFADEETCVASKALTAYTFLRTVKKVDVIIASCLEGGQAIAPLARRDKIPFFISGRSSADFQAKHPNALSWLSLLDYEGEATARLIIERGWKKGVAMVWSGYFGVQYAEAIKKALKNTKRAFAYEVIEVDQGSNPNGSDVQRLIRGGPDVIFLMMAEPAAAFVVKQLRALRYAGQIVLQSSMLQTYDRGVRADFKGALQQKFPANQKLFAEIQSEIRASMGNEVADDFVFSYDGFTALLKAAALCRNGRSASLDECLSTTLRNEQWREGASGRFRFMRDGSTQRPMEFRVINADGFE